MQGDCITLMCIRPAPAGGASRIACARQIHNTMLARHPELCARLYKPYHRIWEGKVRPLGTGLDLSRVGFVKR